MDLATALLEFSELLDVAAKSLGSLIQAGSGGGAADRVVDEVTSIAERLREISDEVRRT